MNHLSILIIDDEDQLRKLLARILSLEGFDITEAADIKTARQLINRKSYAVVLCDVKLPDGNGLDFIYEIKQKDPLAEVILLTAYGNIADGVTAIKQGAFDYITKGDDNDRIIPLVNQAMEKVKSSRAKAISIKEQTSYNFESIIGNSPVIKHAVLLAKKIAPSETTVLLLGETGTGKEVFANAIHEESKSNGNAFVAINCSAFTRELLEGELFGHKAGAFTGAVKDKKGLIEMADKGTLFLDEIGEMNIELQAKLLRVLENGEFIKLGDTKTTNVSVRLIAATNRDLLKSIGEGTFREDLYYRINVFSIHLPALRERIKDIKELANHFIRKISVKESKTIPVLSDAAQALMEQYEWKGNIRELKNIMERAVILEDDGIILPIHLPYEIQEKQDNKNKGLSLAGVEKSHIHKMLQYNNYNKTKTAETLGIGLTTLYRKMEEYHIPK
ncbi:MAG: sigma-54-dependent Fis family transcriptional regulator [Rhizobacter sp.]|nr:sigma-54-dependent Fis family transcriptional regulator [Ferruginibacter sp.]